jgi:hypothetical protein
VRPGKSFVNDFLPGFFVVAFVLLALAMLAACIVAPLNGVWTPDLAVAFWAVIGLIVWISYRIWAWFQ